MTNVKKKGFSELLYLLSIRYKTIRKIRNFSFTTEWRINYRIKTARWSIYAISVKLIS
jgi:hypothetical protein